MSNNQTESAGHNGTLLFVDDDESTLTMYERMLANENYRIFQATSAEEARIIIEQEAVDIAIVDMIMPGINGAQFLREVQLSHPDVKRFLITGQSNLADSVDGITELEADHYVTKPVRRDDLIEMCNEAISHRSQTDS